MPAARLCVAGFNVVVVVAFALRNVQMFEDANPNVEQMGKPKYFGVMRGT